MNNKKATKRALLTSVMALVMCVVMLAGTTFAWFTDTASTGVNKIQAGNLKVDIIGETGNDHVEKLDFTKKVNVTTDGGTTEVTPAAEIFWEPGCRYLTQGFRIANKGNLALKWKAVVNKGTTADNPGKFDLLDVIDFYLVTKNVDGTTKTEEALTEFTGNLKKTETSDVYYIKGVMKTTAGNDYQSLTLEGITITVYATQLTAEFDSFDNQYDKDAKYTEVIAGGKTFTDKATLSTGITATDRDAVAVKATGPDANVTILDGTFDGGSGGDNVCVWAKDGAKVTIKDGTFTVGGDANGNGNAVIYSTGGSNITIEGGFFYTNYSYNNKYYVLNQNNNDSGTITVKGGTFVNYDPSKGDDNLGGTFVAPGYSVISEKHGEDTWYTVVKGTGATAGTQTELDNAITNNTTSTVKLTTAGTYTLPDELQGKDITVIGTKDTVVNMASNDCYHADNVSLEGVTVEFANEDYRGFKHTGKLTYKDCTITGKQFLYGTEVEFINCTFVQDAVDYNVWTYGAGSVLFKDCTFDCKGKAVLIYNEGHISSQNVEFQNCKFKASAPVNGKAAIEIDCTYTSYNVVIDKATADNVAGFADGSVSGSPIWNVKLGSKPTTVALNGTQVYPTV